MSPRLAAGESAYLLPSALAATLTVPRVRGKGSEWQYHSRSDHHSKVCCLLMMLDLMLASEALRHDVEEGRVACGINHTMRDHANYRKKDFDLVLHRPGGMDNGLGGTTFKQLLGAYGVEFSPAQRAVVDALPDVPTRPVRANAVYVAYEAKAAMTAFGKARPRLYDELNSSHLTIHGDTASAIAAALVLVNTAETFVSPVINANGGGAGAAVTRHRQPEDWISILRKVKELPRRPMPSGFDAIGVIAVDCANDGTPVRLMRAGDIRTQVSPSDLALLDDFEYGPMVERTAHLYEGLPHRR